MKSHTKHLMFHTKERMEFGNMTGDVEDDEPGLHEDYKRWLQWLAPYDPEPAALPPRSHRLDFGPWEQIFYGEFDGRRDKRVMVKIIGE